MGDKTRIEWCDATWNPVTGCTPVSAACDHCYASRQIRSGRTPAVHGSKDFSSTQFHPNCLEQPLRWKKPRRIFVCSMGDLFHESIQLFDVTENIFNTISACHRHTFMILTKRPKRMRAAIQYDLINDPPLEFGMDKWTIIENLWLGITAENQEMADQRIPILLQTPAAKRFVSVEPMLGPVDLCVFEMRADSKLDWVICGGETGPGARECNYEWVNNLKNQCVRAGVPFFFKGWGTHGPMKKSDPHYMKIDGKEWKEIPG